VKKETNLDWYISWFDTPYYHILYKDRDDKEAQIFMTNLTHFTQLSKGSEILDLACGKGRHSIFLNKIGYTVTGVDLSISSIDYAKKFENKTLCFKQHNMSHAFPKKFDAVFNLFTSFGYFENEEDNLKTIRSIKKSLKKEGVGVIDFFNTSYVIKNLVPFETKIIDSITFTIKRHVKDNYIYKDIYFEDNGEKFHFTEKVKALTLSDFNAYFKQTNSKLKGCFGDYDLTPFELESSKRLILIFN